MKEREGDLTWTRRVLNEIVEILDTLTIVLELKEKNYTHQNHLDITLLREIGKERKKEREREREI